MKITKRIILIILSALLVLSAVACGKAEEKPKGDENIPKTPEEKALKIKQAYLDIHKYEGTADDVSLRVFAMFDDTWVMFVDYSYVEYATVISHDIVDNIEFIYPVLHTLKVYNNSTFYSLTEAFDNGILTSENIRTLHESYTNNEFTKY